MATAEIAVLTPFGKKLAKTKIFARVNVKEIKAKSIKESLKSPAIKQQRFFTKICQKWRKSVVFWLLLRLLLIRSE